MFVIEIAGVRIRIENKYSYVERLSHRFLVEGDSYAFSVSVPVEEIERDTAAAGNSPGYCESFGIYRRICEKISAYGVLFMHSAVVEVEGRAYAFTARSGVGKSTHVSLWLRNIPGARVLNGDKPLYRIEPDGSVTACATPWNGKENWCTPIDVPLAGVCFLERGEVNRIRRAEAEEVLPRMFEQLYLKGDRVSVDERLCLLDAMLSSTQFYILECTISDEAARLAYQTMSADGREGKKRYEDQ